MSVAAPKRTDPALFRYEKRREHEDLGRGRLWNDNGSLPPQPPARSRYSSERPGICTFQGGRTGRSRERPNSARCDRASRAISVRRLSTISSRALKTRLATSTSWPFDAGQPVLRDLCDEDHALRRLAWQRAYRLHNEPRGILRDRLRAQGQIDEVDLLLQPWNNRRTARD
ncbi:MAG: hypothetical protein MZV64_52740 [Ignavibacteriales bacterium]|nr:hypothetical protein [Ignavibacteriales bacterium]